MRYTNISEKKLVELYNCADVLLFPSIYEGFGRPPLEAMACGTPVITSNLPFLEQVSSKDKKLVTIVNPHSVKDITNALSRELKVTNAQQKKRSRELIKVVSHVQKNMTTGFSTKLSTVYDEM